MAGALFCLSLFVLGLAIPTVYYGFADEDSTCQEGERGGLNLSDWCKGAGLSAIVVTAWIWIMAGFTLATNHEGFMIGALVVGIADVFFWIMWWIWGVVILATNENNRCVAQGKGMAVMCIINLVLGKVRLMNVSIATNSD
jgi:uncharacterized YccA/Bax inhibitor family protein